MSLSAIPKKLRASVFDRDAGRCRYCGLAQMGQAAAFHINHVIPRSKAGRTEMSNLVLQCTHCSLHKAAKILVVDPLTAAEVELFHPLLLLWEDHFQISGDGTCRGLTAIGRATVEALRMNDPRPLVARAIQIQAGIIQPSEL